MWLVATILHSVGCNMSQILTSAFIAITIIDRVWAIFLKCLDHYNSFVTLLHVSLFPTTI